MTILRASGWHPDLPDRRDYTLTHERVASYLSDLPPLTGRPSRVDWRNFCTPFPQRLEVGDCGGSIHCCLELLEQILFRVQGTQRVLSRQFAGYNAERLADAEGEPPFAIRTAWKAIRRFGVVAASLCPAEAGCAAEGSSGPQAWESPQPGSGPRSRGERRSPGGLRSRGGPESRGRQGLREGWAPDAFIYSAASPFPELLYVRLDHRGRAGSETLDSLRSCLAAGFLCVFGIPLASSAGEEGELAFPTVFETLQGGQTLLAVGYDDHRRIRSDRGCLLVRGGWGRAWGEEGYGWLPYSYVRENLALDFWTILTPEWISSGEFQSPG